MTLVSFLVYAKYLQLVLLYWLRAIYVALECDCNAASILVLSSTGDFSSLW